MPTGKRVLVLMAAVTFTLGGFSSQSFALGKHAPKPPRVTRKTRKNSSPYAYLAPKKQKKPSGYYRSTLNGELIYGKTKK